MKQNVLLLIEDGSQQKVEAKAFSKEDATIYITAATMQEAIGLIPEGEKLAALAMDEWTEKAVKEENVEHYNVAPITMEEATREMNAYEQTTNGKRFARGLELAYNFTDKKDKTGFYSLMQGRYLSLLAYAQDVYDPIMLSYCYGFKKGYKNAKKGGKKC